jgi:hypothetical protein
MQPVKKNESTVDDLLEILLDKGVIIHTDMIISVANIPLIGISLKAAIAGMETMLEYGIMEKLDQKTRQWALDKIRDRKLNLGNKYLKEEMYGSYWESEGIYKAWRPGELYLTNDELIIYQQIPAEKIFITTIKQINGIKVINIINQQKAKDTKKKIIAILLKTGNIEYIYVHKPEELKNSIISEADRIGLKLNNNFEVGDHNVPGSR